MTPVENTRLRIKIIFALIAVFAFYVTFKVLDASVLHHDDYGGYANAQHETNLSIKAKRGNIYDRNGKVLAQSVPAWNIIVSPHEINELAKDKNDPSLCGFICKRVAEITGCNYDKLFRDCSECDDWAIYAAKEVNKEIVDRINSFSSEYNLGNTLYAEETSVRLYPGGTLAANVIGFVNLNNEGYGVEMYYDSYLKGTDGRDNKVLGIYGEAIPKNYGSYYPAKDGNDIYLTIDETLQHYLEKNLEIAVNQHKVENRSCGIIMNAKTGAIVAMATYPTYDLNSPSYIYNEKDRALLEQMKTDGAKEEDITKMEQELRAQQWRNKAISELYIPGSVFKIITCASALEEEVVSTDSTFNCVGVADVAGTKIKCWSSAGHGTSTLTQAMERSCNPAFIAIGQLLGVDRFSKYFDAFGFTSKTGIDLPGEVEKSIYYTADRMGIVELSSSAFGQTNKLTAIQMVSAIAAAVNGGQLVTPHVVEKITDDKGNVIKTVETEVKRRVISEETSAKMREILESVVTTNGGSNAYISGYRIGGKSGTSEKIDEYNSGQHEQLRYVSTFSAVVPANDPEYVMLVVVDEPTDGTIYGSAIAAPVVSSVFKEGLGNLGIYPQYTSEELEHTDVMVPYVADSDAPLALAKLTAAGLEGEIIGSTDGTWVVGQVPISGETMPRGGKVFLYMGTGPIGVGNLSQNVVPNVIGCTVEEANKLLSEAGFNIRMTGAYNNPEARASSQSFTAGSTTFCGYVVDVNFLTNNETG